MKLKNMSDLNLQSRITRLRNEFDELVEELASNLGDKTLEAQLGEKSKELIKAVNEMKKRDEHFKLN